MPIYFVQHGLALPEQIDPNRPLSADGRREVESIAAHLRKVGVAVKKVCHSGKTRARETAQILSEQIGDGNIYAVSGMSPNNNVIEFAAGLKVKQMDLLPYHRLGVSKYSMLDRGYRLDGLQPFEIEEVEKLKQMVEDLGLKCEVGG